MFHCARVLRILCPPLFILNLLVATITTRRAIKTCAPMALLFLEEPLEPANQRRSKPPNVVDVVVVVVVVVLYCESLVHSLTRLRAPQLLSIESRSRADQLKWPELCLARQSQSWTLRNFYYLLSFRRLWNSSKFKFRYSCELLLGRDRLLASRAASRRAKSSDTLDRRHTTSRVAPRSSVISIQMSCGPQVGRLIHPMRTV